MPGVRYVCCDERRRAALAELRGPDGIADWSGIDYVEVRVGATVGDPTEIDVVLVNPLALPRAALRGANVRITGGVRHPAPSVDPDVEEVPGGDRVSTYRVRVPGGQPTDFSTYRLALVSGAASDDPPPGIDPRSAAVDLSFTVDCPTDDDCAPDCRALPEDPRPEPTFDYRVREWDGFRRLMLDRLTVLVPGFRSDDPVDLTTTLVEALAYRADQQSYRLDWVGTEAFLDTARSRTSVTRHARLVDYRPGDGASARCVVAVELLAGSLVVPAATPVLARTPGLPTVVTATTYAALLPTEPLTFTTLTEQRLWPWRSRIDLHTWSDEQCALPRGATAATLVDRSADGGPLAPGDLLVLAEIRSPQTGEEADADPTCRHVVRLTGVRPVTDVLSTDAVVDVTWDAADALPFELTVSSEVAQTAGPPRRVVCATAFGNVLLAQHGSALPPPDHLGLPDTEIAALTPGLDPPAPQPGRAWRPRLLRGPATGALARPARVAAHDLTTLPRQPAVALLTVDPEACTPDLRLVDAFADWTARSDLLASGPFSRDVVVESDATGATTLRFGDGVHGLAPSVGESIGVRGLFGVGVVGDVGPGTLGHLVLSDAAAGAAPTVERATNPLAARGGAEPESVAAVRVAAPQAFRVQDRAVTAADYAAAALRYPGVANAKALPRWTGSWQTVLVLIDRLGGAPLDDAFRAGLLAHMERFRLAGFDVAVRAARALPLDVALTVCAAPDQVRGTIGRRVREALTPFGVAGKPGFFHPDRFGFGTPLYLSALVGTVMAVSGVQSVTPTVFQRFGRTAQDELARGVIRPPATEVLELADDPDFPERGRLRITMRGGR
ncbi:baseplate J/gp47 family protein [Actinomycetospora lutea]|uniref:baseplate J/gp47 family protein n=1 Tax=Actinomycetospora lutea TaxID=663604 RepID=UPI002365DE56|nr:baseplate J/gp47 family protein [Actinomycetospora lutea]MDD7942413.1 baseplate J/gp47 family protein [Actinomycetospora lutea]